MLKRFSPSCTIILRIFTWTYNDCNDGHASLESFKNRTPTINEVPGRRLPAWRKGDLYNLMIEAKTFRERPVRKERKRNFNEFREFDKHMASGELKNVIGCLLDESKVRLEHKRKR